LPERDDPFLDGGCRYERVFFADQLDFDDDAGVAVESAAELRVFEAVDDGGNLAESNEGAVGAGEDDDVFEVGALIGLPLRAKQDFASAGFDGSAGQIEREFSDGTGDAVEVDPVSAKCVFGNLDRDFVGAVVVDDRLGYAGEAYNFVAGALAEFLQFSLGDRPGDRHFEDRALDLEFRDPGAFAFDREGIDRVDSVFNFACRCGDIGADRDLGGHDAYAFGRAGDDAVDIRCPLDRFFDSNTDGLFNLSR